MSVFGKTWFKILLAMWKKMFTLSDASKCNKKFISSQCAWVCYGSLTWILAGNPWEFRSGQFQPKEAVFHFLTYCGQKIACATWWAMKVVLMVLIFSSKCHLVVGGRLCDDSENLNSEKKKSKLVYQLEQFVEWLGWLNLARWLFS